MKNIAILASGSGTNAENIARFFNNGSRIRVALVITNRKNAGVIDRMKPLDINVEYIPNRIWDEEPEQIVETLRSHEIELVVLAGFMHYVSPVIINAFPNRVINIHPSLLPAYGGKGMWGHHVHEAVITAGEKKSGVTVHYVDEEFDSGEILMQQVVEILPDDTPETLETRIHQAEYELYPRAIAEAMRRLDSNSDVTSTAKEEAETKPMTASEPPAIPKSVEEEWSEVLKVNYDPSSASVPPPMPVTGRPQQPSQTDSQPSQATTPLNTPTEKQPMPPTYLLWSILCTICCCFPPGIAAIVFSLMVSSRHYNGDHEGAQRASRMAEIWIIVSFVLGVLSASLYIPLSLV